MSRFSTLGAHTANLPSVRASVGLEVKRGITADHAVDADRCVRRWHFVTLLMVAVDYPTAGARDARSPAGRGDNSLRDSGD